MLAEIAASVVLWAVPPAPHPLPAVHYAPCPGDWRPCYIGGQGFNDVYMPSGENAWTREHEYGHAFDRLQLVDGERAAIARTLRWRRWDPERFANWYAGCRTRSNPRSLDGWVYEPFRNPKRIARRCAMIARAG